MIPSIYNQSGRVLYLFSGLTLRPVEGLEIAIKILDSNGR